MTQTSAAHPKIFELPDVKAHCQVIAKQKKAPLVWILHITNQHMPFPSYFLGLGVIVYSLFIVHTHID